MRVLGRYVKRCMRRCLISQMMLRSLFSGLRRKVAEASASEPPSGASVLTTSEERATTFPLDRLLTGQERAIAEWLLENANQTSKAYIPQLDHIRVVGRCSCGCPTADFRVAEGILPAAPQDNPIGDAIGYVNGKMVGVMLLQRAGYLTCLEVYDLSDIEHPYPLPDLKSLEPFKPLK
jgi:hypothetical protein